MSREVIAALRRHRCANNGILGIPQASESMRAANREKETIMPSEITSALSGETPAKSGTLQRSLDWRGAFWVAAGVPPLVLFSIGGIAGVAGQAAFVVWIISMIMGFSQSFTYAEIAGMFGNKSGGTSIYGATAWLRYSKLIAPLSVWCNWFAWSPVLSLGCAIAAGYILNALFAIPASDSQPVLDWIAANGAQFTAGSQAVVDYIAANAGTSTADAISAVSTAAGVDALTPVARVWEAFNVTIPGLGTLHFNSTFVIGTVLMLIIFAIQHRGIASTARAQKILAVIVLVPLFLVGVVPIVTGSIDYMNVSDIIPPSVAYGGDVGSWNVGGWTLFLGALYIAAWSTYGFETAVCYTAEMKDPARDTFKAIFFSGLLCMVFYFLIPFSFQGVFGAAGMLDPGIVDGTGIAHALGSMVSSSNAIAQVFVILMILALFLAIMTAMAGSSRTLYQGSRDGWLPKYLSHVNDHGAPTNAMWTDLGFNLFLLALASDAGGYFYVLAISNVGYLTFNFLNLNAGWIHRIELRPCVPPVEGADRADRVQHASCLCQRTPARGRCEGLGLFRRALVRHRLRGSHHSGVLVPPLCSGRRQVSTRGVGGPWPFKR